MKRALITGVGGQDGSYLAEHLHFLGYEVFGTVRHKVSPNIKFISPFVKLLFADMRDKSALDVAIRKSQPDEIYNLAGQVFVPTSWTNANATYQVNLMGLQFILELVEKINPKIKVYQASSSEMFGNILNPDGIDVLTLNENVPMHPVSPYGLSKLAAHHLCHIYRDKGLFVCSGILFNHESPRRGEEMVTRKIARHVAAWATKEKKDWPILKLGNFTSKRDWGYAGDYVQAMHSMLQQSEPDDYVIGTGESHSIMEFIDESLKVAGVNLNGNEVEDYIRIDELFRRSNELHVLVADSSKANKKFGWKSKVNFSSLVEMMVTHEIKLITG